MNRKTSFNYFYPEIQIILKKFELFIKFSSTNLVFIFESGIPVINNNWNIFLTKRIFFLQNIILYKLIESLFF